MSWYDIPEGFYAAPIFGRNGQLVGHVPCKRGSYGWSKIRHQLLGGFSDDDYDVNRVLDDAEDYVSRHIDECRAAFIALRSSCERCGAELTTDYAKWLGEDAICAAKTRLENIDEDDEADDGSVVFILD